MAQNCEYPGCLKPTATGKLLTIANITGEGKDHISVRLCDTCEALRRLQDPTFSRWLKDRIRTAVRS